MYSSKANAIENAQSNCSLKIPCRIEAQPSSAPPVAAVLTGGTQNAEPRYKREGTSEKQGRRINKKSRTILEELRSGSPMLVQSGGATEEQYNKIMNAGPQIKQRSPWDPAATCSSGMEQCGVLCKGLRH
jgi:hypothetical protein